MKILLAPDKFKGSLTALEVCHALKEGITAVIPSAEVIFHPLADGGEGSIELLAGILPLQKHADLYPDPLQRPAWSHFYTHQDKAYIEMALTAGLAQLSKEEYNCLETDTVGLGYQIKDAIRLGVNEIYLFIGGSATNEGGIGMASVLGYRFLDKEGYDLIPTAGNLLKLEKIVPPPHQIFEKIRVKVISDVKNPLLGPQGATFVYAPQKGGRQSDLPLMEAGLAHLAKLIKRDLGKDVESLKGGGAAGGLGAGAAAFLNAEVLPGIDTIMNLTAFDQALEGTDLLISGEGKLDHQSLQGKVIDGVARKARQKGVPLAIFCGSLMLSEDELKNLGVVHVDPILKDGITLERAMTDGKQLLSEAAKNWFQSEVFKGL